MYFINFQSFCPVPRFSSPCSRPPHCKMVGLAIFSYETDINGTSAHRERVRERRDMIRLNIHILDIRWNIQKMQHKECLCSSWGNADDSVPYWEGQNETEQVTGRHDITFFILYIATLSNLKFIYIGLVVVQFVKHPLEWYLFSQKFEEPQHTWMSVLDAILQECPNCYTSAWVQLTLI